MKAQIANWMRPPPCVQRVVRPRPAWYVLPKIPKGWHRMKQGALVRPTDLYFNFSDRRWMQWPYKTTIVRHTGNDLTSPFYIRRNRKWPNEELRRASQ